MSKDRDLERIQPPPDPVAWDDFVRSQAGWTAFHLTSWQRVIERTFGHRVHALEARRDGEIVGVLPLATVKSRLFGHYLISMPFVSYGGPLGDAPAVEALIAHARSLADDLSVDLLQLRARKPLPTAMDVSTHKVTVLLELPESPEALWDGLKAKVRSQVRRPRKEGFEVRFGDDQVAGFWKVFAHHMRDLGTPVMPHAFFEILAEELGDTATFGCVYDGEIPIAGGCTIEWGTETEITWASSLRSYNRQAPNMLLYWSFMERAIERGQRAFNFGRCTPDGGTHHFKRQWGGRDEPLYWYRHGGGRAGTPSPDDGKYAMGVRLWQRIPLPIANVLGPRIVKYIP